MAKTYTKEDIKALLLRQDAVGVKAIGRALLALKRRQTHTEQVTESTRLHNGIGFTGADARMGTSMATQFQQRGFLSPKQVAYWRRPNVRGVPRIVKYTGQLLEEANGQRKVA